MKVIRVTVLYPPFTKKKLNIPYDDLLEINHIILNLFVLNDGYGYGGSFVKNGDDPHSLSKGNKEGNSHTPAYVETIALMTSSLSSYNELEV